MALRCWTELELGNSAQLKRTGWEYFPLRQHLFHRSHKPRRSSTRFVGSRSLAWFRRWGFSPREGTAQQGPSHRANSIHGK